MSSLIVRWLLPSLERALAERIAAGQGPIHKVIQVEHNRRTEVQRHAEKCRDILWAGMPARNDGLRASSSAPQEPASLDPAPRT